MKKNLQNIIAFLFLTVLCPPALFAQWTPTVSISPAAVSAGLNENMGPCLAVSGDTIHTVWSDKQGSNYVIYYSHSLDTGNTWSNAVPLTALNARATMPVIAVSGPNVHVVWMDSLSGVRASYYKRSTDGGTTWGNTVLVDANTIFWPGVACHGNKVFITLDKGTFNVNTEVWMTTSVNNGTTWSAQQQISNAAGRSEDQHIATDGSNVHLTWNDNRSGTMQIYYRHSNDGGITWGPETAIFLTASYTTMVSLFGPYVDIAVGNQAGGNFDVWLAQSADTAATWANPNKQLTATAGFEAYPFMVRDGMNLYMVYRVGTGSEYISSSNGGTTWSAPVVLGSGGQPFIAITGSCMLHAIWPNNGKVIYSRNRIAVCNASAGISKNEFISFTIAPNPGNGVFDLSGEENLKGAQIEVRNLVGQTVYTQMLNGINTRLNLETLTNGMYQVRVIRDNAVIYSTKIVKQ